MLPREEVSPGPGLGNRVTVHTVFYRITRRGLNCKDQRKRVKRIKRVIIIIIIIIITIKNTQKY